ncbi:Mitochondrial fission process 1 [Nesidiocoris tenuis]|uniref:Mitochondrial fission process protein 1 n=1 Tax=Nesidiocoris tenuis TaxID=355587 RepID=A0ABN7BHI3_9HEMI|nr:Mitochondrial fission process 1 [Nesidiocoris tenuis]
MKPANHKYCRMSKNSGTDNLVTDTNDKGTVDVFRDTPLRYLGYANEVGEAFRPVIDEKLVWGSYGVASLYVLADTVSKAVTVWRNEHPSSRFKESVKTGVDVLVWQSFASVIIPGFTINRICALSSYLLRRSPVKKYSKPMTVAIGLCSIPLIIHPIDRGVDFAMDRSVRPILRGI